jgi:hypothetical protein
MMKEENAENYTNRSFTICSLCVIFLGWSEFECMCCSTSPEPKKDSVIWQNTKNTESERLLQIVCFQSQVLGFFTQDEPLRRYTLYIINSKITAMLT